MDYYDIKRLALISAINAEVEAMKVANLDRAGRNEASAYDEEAFMDKAAELHDAHYRHNEQL